MTILLTPFHDIINLSEIYETEPLIYEKAKTFMDDPKTNQSTPDSFRRYCRNDFHWQDTNSEVSEK